VEQEIPHPTSFHHKTGSLLQIKFDVDMGEWTTSWRFIQVAYEYHEDVEHQLSRWQKNGLDTKL
jgi:hypothetical protein